MKNDKSLETFLVENQDLFYYPNFNSKDISTITNEYILLFIEPPVKLSDTESKLFLIHSNVEIPSCRSTRVQYKPQLYGTITRHLAISSSVKKIIYKPLTYNKTLHSPKAMQW